MKTGWVLASLILLTACQAPPTRVQQSESSPGESMEESILSREPVIFDVRSLMDYGVSRVPRSINLQWSDLLQPGAPVRGTLTDDMAMAKRMALWGVEPSSEILIIGYGLNGHGEEGWLGWYFTSLGVPKVNLGTTAQFRPVMPRDFAPENKPYWVPQVRKDLRITSAELRRPARRRATAPKSWIVDTRMAALREAHPLTEFLSEKELERYRVASVEWINFWNEKNHPSDLGVYTLRKAGMGPDDEVILVSDDGLESGSVALSLIQTAFGRPRNLMGGLNGLKAKK